MVGVGVCVYFELLGGDGFVGLDWCVDWLGDVGIVCVFVWIFCVLVGLWGDGL